MSNSFIGRAKSRVGCCWHDYDTVLPADQGYSCFAVLRNSSKYNNRAIIDDFLLACFVLSSSQVT